MSDTTDAAPTPQTPADRAIEVLDRLTAAPRMVRVQAGFALHRSKMQEQRREEIHSRLFSPRSRRGVYLGEVIALVGENPETTSIEEAVYVVEVVRYDGGGPTREPVSTWRTLVRGERDHTVYEGPAGRWQAILHAVAAMARSHDPGSAGFYAGRVLGLPGAVD